MPKTYTSDDLWPAGVPNTSEREYLEFMPGIPEQEVVRRFVDLYGAEPEYIVRHRGWVWVPKPKEEKR